MRFDSFVLSKIGLRHENQDAAAVLPLPGHRFAACVADGVGGSAGGAKASSMTVQGFLESVAKDSDQDLLSLLQVLDARVKSAATADPALSKMATTLSACILGENELRGVHTGDSRIYLLRGNGIRQLTQDQTEVERLYAAGKLSDQEAIHYFRRNVLEGALGGENKLAGQLINVNLLFGDRLVLTTDGVHSKLSKVELRDLSKSSLSAQQLCERVAGDVKERGPSDNYTVVAVCAVP